MYNLKCIKIAGICLVLLACGNNKSTFVETQNFNNDWDFKLTEASQLDSSYFKKGINIKSREKVQFPYTPELEPKIEETHNSGMVIPNYSGDVTFSIEVDAELIGENPVSCALGIASILIQSRENKDDIEVTENSSDLFVLSQKIKTRDFVLKDKIQDSLPLIPRIFLEHQNKSKGYCFAKGDSSKKKVALTFDDGPTDLSKKIIEILNSNNVNGTFFWLGKNLEKNTSIIKQAKEAGHLIANHSWDHQNGWETSNEDLWNTQVEKTFKELELKGICKSKYYRPPFGAITQEQINFLATKGITSILWSITTMDWDKTQNSEEEMLKKFKEYLHNGAIVLFHDFDFGNSQAKLKAIEQMIIYGKSMGFIFVTIDDIL